MWCTLRGLCKSVQPYFLGYFEYTEKILVITYSWTVSSIDCKFHLQSKSRKNVDDVTIT